MNWYSERKASAQSVMVTSYTGEYITALIDGKRYYCPGFYPKQFALLNKLIKEKSFGRAAGLLRDWPCNSKEFK